MTTPTHCCSAHISKQRWPEWCVKPHVQLPLVRYRVAPLVASSPTYHLHAGGHHIQDTICWHSGLPSHLIDDYLPARTLRSSVKLLLIVPRMALALSAKAFSVSAPSVWNSLSYNCRSAELFSTFKRNLKTELFDIAYSKREHSTYSLCHYASVVCTRHVALYK